MPLKFNSSFTFLAIQMYLISINAVIMNISNENKIVLRYNSSVIGKPVTSDTNNSSVGQKTATKKGSTNLVKNFLLDT
ncbi:MULTISPECIES: hypothetical protein [Aeromonas]|uniref:hypothetical protein n=1 Tax=Aeromonas TaxID=642 RepID=UPI0010080727